MCRRAVSLSSYYGYTVIEGLSRYQTLEIKVSFLYDFTNTP